MSKKRGNGEGTVIRRPDGRWEARLRLEDANGRIVRKSVYGKSRDEVNRKLYELQRQKHDGSFNTDASQKMADFLETWLIQHVQPTREPRTAEFYARMVRKDIIPAIGHIPLERLKPPVIQKFYSTLLDAGRSKSTVKKIHITLHAALAIAEKQQIIARNPAHFVTPPKPDVAEPLALDAEQTRKFCHQIRNHPFEVIYVFALDSGCRQGEILGLKWHDINFTTGAVKVDRSLKRTAKNVFLGPPKTKKSRRTLIVNPVTLDLFRLQQSRQTEMRKQAGDLWKPRAGFENLVFTTETGNPFDGARLTVEMKKICAQAEIPYVKFKGLRSTHSTLLAVNGISPRVIQERLGHATLDMTLRIYTAVQPSMRAEATRVIESYLVTHKQNLGADSPDVRIPTQAGGGQNGGQTAPESRQFLVRFSKPVELFGKLWFPMMDSNHHKQSQSLLSYH